MANPGMPDPPGGADPAEMPPRPFPGERPLGADEPSAPYEEPTPDEPLGHGIGPGQGPGDPAIPGPRL